MSNRSEAKKLLVHYFKVAKPDLQSDCLGEIEDIVEFIVRAAIDEIRQELKDTMTLAAGESLE